MSHVSSIEIKIQDLDTLKRACEVMELVFMENAKAFKAYQGEQACDHAIRVPGAAYEVGVARADGGWELLWDDWHTGGLVEALGPGAGRLKQAYAVERVRSEARRQGMRLRVRRMDTDVQLVLSQ